MDGACDRLMSGGEASGARNDTGTGQRTLVGPRLAPARWPAREPVPAC